MKRMLKDFSNLLLVVLCDYVFGEAEYLLLGEPGHVALSNSTVSVDFQYLEGTNGTLRNVSVLLLEANTNQTVTTKHLLTNESQGTLEFECFYFKEAGDYWFIMTPEVSDNFTLDPWLETSVFLKVEWPVFHVDLNRTSQAAEGTFQKLGGCGSHGTRVAPRVGMVSESVAVCVSLPSPADLAAWECPRRPPCVPWRSVLLSSHPAHLLFRQRVQ